MINITILQNQDNYIGIECFGHALYASHGKDIVCAAVSTLVINTINSIEQFTDDAITLDVKDPDEKKSVFKKASVDDNYIKFLLTEDISKESKILMDSLVLGLTEINKQYGDSYLTLNFREV